MLPKVVAFTVLSRDRWRSFLEPLSSFDGGKHCGAGYEMTKAWLWMDASVESGRQGWALLA
jgi:hypothetical protein